MSLETLAIHTGLPPPPDYYAKCIRSGDLKAIANEINRTGSVDTVWTQTEVEGLRPTGGCVAFFGSGEGEQSWVNYSTPFHLAVRQKNKEAAILLLEKGFDVNCINAAGRTALHEAARWRNYDSADFLLRNGADALRQSEARWFKDNGGVMRGGPGGLTPFHEAIAVGDARILELLIQKGLDLTTFTEWTLADVALVDEQPSVLELLLTYEIPFSTSSTSDTKAIFTADIGDERSARLLLEGYNVIPPKECRGTFLRLLAACKAQVSFESTANLRAYAIELSTLFGKLLRSVAGVPDLSCFTEQHCARCQAFELAPIMKSQERFELYPTLEQLLRSAEQGCDLCKLFADALEGRKAEHNFSVTIGTYIIDCAVYPCRRLELTCGSVRAELSMFFLEDHLFLPLTSTKTIPDIQVVDTEYQSAKRWLERCFLHEQCCPSSLQETILPTRVINVGDDNHSPFLHVANGQKGQYCALSYCWGQYLPFRTTKQNYQSCQDKLDLHSLPRSICDGIIVARKLGFQYIWIDCICIIQDDQVDWLRETAVMDRIFTNAALMISPVDAADCTGGCFRPLNYRINRPVPISLQLPRYSKAKDGERRNSLCVLPVQACDYGAGDEFRKTGAVDSRCWTLQEQLLAPRILYFYEGMMFWQCVTLNASESDPTAKSYDRLGVSSQDPVLRSIKELIATCNDKLEPVAKERLYLGWQELITHYTTRAITRYTDKIVALAGLNTRIGQGLCDQSVGGIWGGPYALRSLLWVVEKSHPSSDAQSRSGAQQLPFPSWSWASRSSPIDYPWTSVTGWTWHVSNLLFDIQDIRPGSGIQGSLKCKCTVKVFKNFNITQRSSHDWSDPMSDHDSDDEDFIKPPERPLDWETSTQQRRFRKSMREQLKRNLRKRLKEEHGIAQGFKDCDLSADSKETWCLVVARTPREEPPQFGMPVWPKGRPPTVICLCLQPVSPEKTIFRRYGLCEFWDVGVFWDGVRHDVDISII